MKTSAVGISMITRFEQYHDGDLNKIGLQPKMCPAGIWTVGLGHALVNQKNGQWLRGTADYPLVKEQYPQFLTLTKNEADVLLRVDLVKFEDKLNQSLRVQLQQHQFDALVSYTFNIGWSETMMRLINANSPMKNIVDWWENHYITANGVKMPGLIKRRKSEAHLYSTGKVSYFGL